MKETVGAEEENEKGSGYAKDNVVNTYFQEMRKYKLLTADEEKELGRKARNGDMQAREALINANLRLVVSIAKRYQWVVAHLKMSDLIQAGNMGLIKAVGGFDPDHGGRFSTYATYWIEQALQHEIGWREQTIRNPMHVGEVLRRYNKATCRLAHKLSRAPTVSEVAAEMEESEVWVRTKEKLFKRYLSFDEPVGDGNRTFGDFIAGSDGVEAETSIFRAEFKEKFAEIFDKSPLNDVQKKVLRLRFGIDGNGERLTLEKISKYVGVTRERIRQIEAKALKKLKKRLKLFEELV